VVIAEGRGVYNIRKAGARAPAPVSATPHSAEPREDS
jgi:hypothetical protein